MRSKLSWFVVALLVLGLFLGAVSCKSETAAPAGEEEEAPVVEEEEEEPVVEEEEEEPVVEEEEEEPVVEEEEEEVAAGPPDIPTGHATASCSVCHEEGIGGAPQWPGNHADFDEEICASCHELAE